jgi:hypothetical protein
MRILGDFPLPCRPRKKLIDRLLLDLQTTQKLSGLWDRDTGKNREYVHFCGFFGGFNWAIGFIVVLFWVFFRQNREHNIFCAFFYPGKTPFLLFLEFMRPF